MTDTPRGSAAWPSEVSIGGQCPVHYQPLGTCCPPAVQYVCPPDLAAIERKRLAESVRALVGRDHCKACELRWASGNRRHCRRCRTSHALAYAIEADTVAEHMLRLGGKNGQGDDA